jgi:hypothetical protein
MLLPNGIFGDASRQVRARILVNMVSIDLIHLPVRIRQGCFGEVAILSFLERVITPRR